MPIFFDFLTKKYLLVDGELMHTFLFNNVLMIITFILNYRENQHFTRHNYSRAEIDGG